MENDKKLEIEDDDEFIDNLLDENKNKDDNDDIGLFDDLDKVDNETYKFANEEYNNLNELTIENIEKHKIILPSLDRKTLITWLENISKNQKQFKERLEKTNSLESTLIKMVDVFSSQYTLLKESLESVKKSNKEINSVYPYTIKKIIKDENGEESTKEVSDVIKDSYPKFTKSFNGKILKGKDVQLYTLTKHRNIKKTILPNSGIYVLIQGPVLSDLDRLYNKLIDSIGEYNYLFGTCSYLYSDLQIKEAFMEFIKSLIVSSNLKNWNKGNTLYRNISFHDYPVLLHSICSLMFKSGYEYKYICSNNECQYIETEIIDVNELKQYILSKIPNTCIDTLTSRKIKSQTILEQYRTDLELNTYYKPYKNYKIYLKVPTMLEYFNFGDEFNANMIENIHDITDSNKINRYLKYSYFKIFTPWIEKIEVLNDDDTINYIVNDNKGIAFTIEQMQNDYNDDYSGFTDPIIDFIKNSALTLIAIPLNECPKCKKLPENNIGGYLPIDIQETFFSMLTMRLLLK